MKPKPKRKLAYRAKVAIVVMVVSFILFSMNQNGSLFDLFNPLAVLEKSRRIGGFMYAVSFAAFWGAVVGLVARSITLGCFEK